MDWSPAINEEAFKKRLQDLGLIDEAIQLLADKFIDKKTFQDICKERGYTSPMQAFRYYKRILEDLKLKLGNTPKRWWK